MVRSHLFHPTPPHCGKRSERPVLAGDAARRDPAHPQRKGSHGGMGGARTGGVQAGAGPALDALSMAGPNPGD